MATAPIAEPKDGAAVRLTVMEARREDMGRHIVRIDPGVLEELGARSGDVVQVTGKTSIVAKVMPTFRDVRGSGGIQMDGLTRVDAGVALGQKVAVRRVPSRSALRVVMAPLDDVALSEDDIEYVAKRLDGLATRMGDRVRINLFGARHQDFTVLRTEPEGVVVVHAETLLVMSKTREKAPVPERGGDIVTYDDIAGLDRELEKIREMVELPLSHPEIFQRLGISPPKGVLLYGPPGCGKTLLGKAVANETEAAFIYVSGPEIIQKFYGESEARLRKIFEDARRRAPCIIFFDEIESIAPKRERVEGEVEKRVVAQLLALMDGLEARGQVVVIAATNMPNAIDPALRRPGRFDREVAISIPNAPARRQILEIHSRGMPLAQDVDLDRLAEMAHGFTGADLAALCRETAMLALRHKLPSMAPGEERIPYETLMSIELTMDDFVEALGEIEPTAMREFFVEVPNVSWDQVGGMEDIKQVLVEAVQWPLKYSELFEQAALQPPRGILLYGPPGNGKTLIVKALATEGGINFISVKGPQLLSKYVGESERAVRELFGKARQAAPCIVFMDEIDSLAPKRGSGEQSAVTDRVVSQLLTEIDGIEPLKGVWVLAATNRRDMIDEALLRPGRFDFELEVPRPEAAGREAILRVHSRGRSLAGDVDLAGLAQRAEGMSGAELKSLCDRAALNALRRAVVAGAAERMPAEVVIGREDFAEAERERR